MRTPIHIILLRALQLVLVAPFVVGLADGWSWILLGSTLTGIDWNLDRRFLALVMIWPAFVLFFPQWDHMTGKQRQSAQEQE